MNIAVAILIVVAATAISIVAMLRVRRRAPDGSYFHDGDRAAGVFGVLATGDVADLPCDRTGRAT